LIGVQDFYCFFSVETSRNEAFLEREKTMKAKRIIQIGSLFVLLVMLCSIPASGQDIDTNTRNRSADDNINSRASGAVERAVLEAMAAFKGAPLTSGASVEIKRSKGEWAFGSVSIQIPSQESAADQAKESHSPLPEGYLWLAREVAPGQWEGAIDLTPTFISWVDLVPKSILSKEEKSVLGQKGNKSLEEVVTQGDPAGDFSLPWEKGQTWRFAGGPHGWSTAAARPWSSLDFAGGDGKVRATRIGVAFRMCQNSTWIQVRHPDGWTTDYYHLANLQVANGAQVYRGTYLGDTSTTVACGGTATGPHVHLTIRYNNNYLDWNGREIGGWTIYEGGAAYQGRAERSYVGGNTVVPAGSNGIYSVGVFYQAHVQNVGWQGEKRNGEPAGTTGEGLRLEAIRIGLKKDQVPTAVANSFYVCYQAYVQGAWQPTKCGYEIAGTVGQSVPIEAIKAWIVNPPNRMGIAYRAHVQNIGWQPLVRDGQVAGTTGQGLRIEALEFYVTP
jgi:LasA protease